MIEEPYGIFPGDEEGHSTLKVRGIDLRELFTNAAEGLFSTILDPNLDDAEKVRERKFDLKAEGRESLLTAWLLFLIKMHNENQEIYFDFRFDEMDEKHIIGRAFGLPTKGDELGIRGIVEKAIDIDSSNRGLEASIELINEKE